MQSCSVSATIAVRSATGGDTVAACVVFRSLGRVPLQCCVVPLQCPPLPFFPFLGFLFRSAEPPSAFFFFFLLNTLSCPYFNFWCFALILLLFEFLNLLLLLLFTLLLTV